MNMWTVTCLKKLKGKIERLSKNDLNVRIFWGSVHLYKTLPVSKVPLHLVPYTCKLNTIDNEKEFSAILLHCDEAVNCLAYDYNKHLN
jgi:hypothetical protein